jgi:hypothetical protein
MRVPFRWLVPRLAAQAPDVAGSSTSSIDDLYELVDESKTVLNYVLPDQPDARDDGNLQSISQAGCRGFDPRLTLFQNGVASLESSRDVSWCRP